MPRACEAVTGRARCARRLRRPLTASRHAADCLDGEGRGSRPRRTGNPKGEVVREHHIWWSVLGCANSTTNRKGARQHPDRSAVRCQGPACHGDEARRSPAGGGGPRADACLGDLLGLRRDQDAHPRRQADPGVAAPRSLAHADAGAVGGAKSSLSPLRRSRRAGAVGAHTVAVHAPVRGRRAASRSRHVDQWGVPPARLALDLGDAAHRTLGRGVGRAPLPTVLASTAFDGEGPGSKRAG